MTPFERIRKQFTVPDAFELWRDYRESLTSLILSQMKGGDEIAVPGAGRCCDIDLSLLAEKARSITLIDTDREGMEEAVKRYAIPSSKVRIIARSLTGAEDTDTERFFDALYLLCSGRGSALSEQDFASSWAIALGTLQGRLFTKEQLREVLPPGRYDGILACGLFSQLFSFLSCSFHALSDAAGMKTAAFDAEIIRMNRYIIPLLLSVMTESAKSFLIIGNEWDEKSPVEGADEAIAWVRNRCPLRQECFLSWPFLPDENRTYTMLMQVIH